MSLLKKFLFGALLLFPAAYCRADGPSVEQAEKYYQTGDAAKARDEYRNLLLAQPDRAALPATFYYDYGTAAAKAGFVGEGYSALLRAAFAAPFDPDTRHNLKLVEAQLPVTASGIQPSLWMTWWPKSLRTIPWRLWALLALVTSAATLLLARAADRTWASGAGALTTGLLLWGALAWQQTRLPVFGLTAVARVKSGPGATFSDIQQLEPGSLVNEELMRDGWLKIRFLRQGADDDTVGWIEPENALQIL